MDVTSPGDDGLPAGPAARRRGRTADGTTAPAALPAIGGLSPEVEALIERAIRTEPNQFSGDGLVGLSCLADGADQIFARAVVDLCGQHAVAVHRLDYMESTSQAHMDASIEMLKQAHLLFAVWAGLPARSFGGTADVVAHAWQTGVPVTVIWPEGAQRS